MKNAKLFLILSILFISISCHSQYYLSDPVYSEEGRVFTAKLHFQGVFSQIIIIINGLIITSSKAYRKIKYQNMIGM